MSKPEPFELIDAEVLIVDEPPRDQVTSLRARVDHAEHVAAIAEFNEKAPAQTRRCLWTPAWRSWRRR